ncbi:uncharacterized protein LOC111705392 isoform X2 [Eurytemora carolleeae]|uniref:uncharacterized protein LOC111705392 isoform X2 n=1 Tax=Eurytemora carolleeae TaxID=1294199 RepID=UPI000C75C1CB|nr:uncharacterized protein LOC111705392 isoform X2 [Eurytemora carolleeae]|eukprot:XP_023333690.1 uncharacterized protein LOC111705392 isoform X2 [Eurytemora affinis]
MELEDDTPQVEDRSMLEALEVLGINPGIESQETTPSSEDVSMPSAIPGVGRRLGGELEEDMSQSYHEIFETQAYMQKREEEDEEKEEKRERRRTNEDVKAPKIEKSKETISRGPGGTDIISPSSDLVGSENSGSTETGIKGDVYLRDGRLVCDEDTENARDYLTSKLVADSLMWQQTFRNDSPSPEECLVQETIKQTKVTNPVSQKNK